MTLFLVLASALSVRYVLLTRERKRREAGYELTLRSYSEKLKPGMARKNVEDSLHTNGAKFSQMGPDDLVEIGHEREAPWYCSGQSIFLEFEFWTAKVGMLRPRQDSDTLTGIKIMRAGEGCL